MKISLNQRPISISVIPDSVRAKKRSIFTNDILTEIVNRTLSAQGQQEISNCLAMHGIESRFNQSLLTPPLAKEFLTPDKFLKNGPPFEDAAVEPAFIPETNRPKKACATSEAWSFSLNKRELFNAKIHIPLTTIESLLLKQLVLSDRRVCSKEELILGIDRDPSHYSGLEMCLSRLQDKFNNAHGERLFRSVRNRGYCLVQEVKTTP